MYTGYGVGLQVKHKGKFHYPEKGVSCGTHSYSIKIPPGMIMITGVKKYKDPIKTNAKVLIKDIESNEFQIGIHKDLLDNMN